jgi:hypothetical protein
MTHSTRTHAAASKAPTISRTAITTPSSGGANAPSQAADQNHRIKSDETLLRKKVTGTEKAARLAEFRAILDWPGLYHLAATIDGPAEDAGSDTRPRRRGRRSGYLTAILVFVVLAERVTGSRASALSELHERAVWESLEETWNGRPENAARPFPAQAPNRDQVEYFRDRLTSNPMRAALQEAFQKVAVAQACRFGNFDPSTKVDWANPSLRHTIIGDGMVLKPFSDVTEVFDPLIGDTRFVGSRAAGKSRGAGEVTDLTEDEKLELTGINHVILQTPTQYGPVVLATGYAAKAEVREALSLLDQVTDRLDGAAHNLLWDRIFTGWTLDYLLGRHRIRVFNKSVGANSKRTVKQPHEEDSIRAHQNWDAQEFIGRIQNNDRFELRDVNARPARHLDPKAKGRLARERKTLFAQWRNDELYQRYYGGESLPLGVCIYPATSSQHITGSRNQVHRKKVDVVRSKFHHFGERAHETGQGSCTHDLYVDDGAIHDVVYDGEAGCYVKVATATCISSTPRKRRDDLWGTTEIWELPCAHGTLTFTTQWNPHGVRRDPDSDEKYPAVDTVLSSLRPIARSQHQKFANFAHRRNDAESWNNWYQRRLPNYGRAASLSVGAQMIDLLAGGCVRNALTWAEWQHAD